MIRKPRDQEDHRGVDPKGPTLADLPCSGDRFPDKHLVEVKAIANRPREDKRLPCKRAGGNRLLVQEQVRDE